MEMYSEEDGSRIIRVENIVQKKTEAGSHKASVAVQGSCSVLKINPKTVKKEEDFILFLS